MAGAGAAVVVVVRGNAEQPFAGAQGIPPVQPAAPAAPAAPAGGGNENRVLSQAEIDALIAKKEQFLTELENYKKSMIYEYVTGKKEAQVCL